MNKKVEELVDKVAAYLGQYAKDARALNRNPNHWECTNTAKELLEECPDLALIDREKEWEEYKDICRLSPMGSYGYRSPIIPLAEALKD